MFIYVAVEKTQRCKNVAISLQVVNNIGFLSLHGGQTDMSNTTVILYGNEHGICKVWKEMKQA